jgi:hypothetical protein
MLSGSSLLSIGFSIVDLLGPLGAPGKGGGFRRDFFLDDSAGALPGFPLEQDASWNLEMAGLNEELDQSELRYLLSLKFLQGVAYLPSS